MKHILVMVWCSLAFAAQGQDQFLREDLRWYLEQKAVTELLREEMPSGMAEEEAELFFPDPEGDRILWLNQRVWQITQPNAVFGRGHGAEKFIFPKGPNADGVCWPYPSGSLILNVKPE